MFIILYSCNTAHIHTKNVVVGGGGGGVGGGGASKKTVWSALAVVDLAIVTYSQPGWHCKRVKEAQFHASEEMQLDWDCLRDLAYTQLSHHGTVLIFLLNSWDLEYFQMGIK